MSIIRKLKSLLGRDDAGAEAERDVTVTVEHDPENEAAVKGAEVEGSGDGDAGETTAAETETGSSTTDAADEADAAAVDDFAADEESVDEEPTNETDESPDEVEIEDAEAGTDTDAADDGGASEPVDVLNGIGSAYAQRLEDAGVDTVGALAEADAAGLSDDTGVAEGRIQGWIDQATEY